MRVAISGVVSSHTFLCTLSLIKIALFGVSPILHICVDMSITSKILCSIFVALRLFFGYYLKKESSCWKGNKAAVNILCRWFLEELYCYYRYCIFYIFGTIFSCLCTMILFELVLVLFWSGWKVTFFWELLKNWQLNNFSNDYNTRRTLQHFRYFHYDTLFY